MANVASRDGCTAWLADYPRPRRLGGSYGRLLGFCDQNVNSRLNFIIRAGSTTALGRHAANTANSVCVKRWLALSDTRAPLTFVADDWSTHDASTVAATADLSYELFACARCTTGSRSRNNGSCARFTL